MTKPMNKPKTLFMGSPEFAVPSLRALVDAGYEVCGVITQPDKPKGRSQKLTPPPVKEAAIELGIEVYQPKTLRDEAFYELLKSLDPELIVVAAYGKMLPTNVLDYPKYNCVNVHASLLPLYRGADPIRRCIIDGREVTGVTIMLMAEGCDTGDMLGSIEVPITADETCESLTAKLAKAGADVLIPTLEKHIAGEIKPTPQDDSCTCCAPKLSDGEIRLDYTCPACCLERLIRAANPAPIAETMLGDKLIKVVSAKAVCEVPAEFPADAPCGYVMTTKKAIFVKCGEGYLQLTSLIPAGKKQMDAAAFINGRQVSSGNVFQ